MRGRKLFLSDHRLIPVREKRTRTDHSRSQDSAASINYGDRLRTRQQDSDPFRHRFFSDVFDLA